MKKHILCIFSVAICLSAQTQPYQVYGVGGLNAGTANATYSINSTNWLGVGLGFHVKSSKTLVKVRAFLGSVNGALGASDLTCGIQTEVGLFPSGTDLASSHTLTSPAAVGWAEFIGFTGTTALTPYTQYRIVLKNANGSPATNFPGYRSFILSGASWLAGGPSVGFETLNASSVWAQPANQPTPIYRLEFADGSFQGLTVENVIGVSSGINTNHRIRSTVASGVTFTTPAGVSWSMSGCVAVIAKIGSPTGTMKCWLDSDDGSTVTNVASSANTYVAATVDTVSRVAPFYFAVPVTLSPSTKYRIHFTEPGQTGTDSTTNYFGVATWIMSNDANSLALLPMQGTWRGTQCQSACTLRANWTDDPVNIPQVWLMLNPAGEATSTGGTGGTRVYSH